LHLHLPCRAVPPPSQLASVSAMSLTGALGGDGTAGPGGSSGRKHGRPLGSRNKVKDTAAMPPVSCRCGHLLGSCNKKTLAALAAAAAADSARAAPAAAAAAASVGAAAAATTPRLLSRRPPPSSLPRSLLGRHPLVSPLRPPVA
jgi:hypothetical protein